MAQAPDQPRVSSRATSEGSAEATSEGSALGTLHAPTRAWFEVTLGKPSKAQQLAFGPLSEGRSALLLAPTGSGKTLAAFLVALDRLMQTPEPVTREAKAERCRVLYVSPLKALAVDIEKNLQVPLEGIAKTARATGATVRVPTVAIRTGDTSQSERAKMKRAPPDILITTPESLFLVLTSEAARTLASVQTVIVDEIHTLVASKRGAHLFLSLERLEALRKKEHPDAPPLQRIGLSATQRPLDVVARLLGGFERGEPRPVAILDAGSVRALEVSIELPDPEQMPEGTGMGKSIWPSMHARLVDIIRAHTSTLLFVNSRRLAERLAAAINETAGEELALAHHGSIARLKRAEIEDRLKRGELRAVVATSSLELGIDMGAIDLVVQIESPPSVAAGLQRIGRSGHGVGAVSRGIVLPKHKGDLLPCATVLSRMREGLVEETFYPENPLDVLAQQAVAVAAMAPISVADLFALVRGAAPFAGLPKTAFEGVLDMLSGRYPSGDFAGLRPRLTWDRTAGQLKAREGAKSVAIANGGTIPDRGLYGVFLAEATAGKRAKRVGELDEEMVFELREGEVFLLGASSWRAETITADRVLVTPAAGEPGKMPFWHGDRPGRPLELGRAVGAFTRALGASSPAAVARLLSERHGMDRGAASALAAYIDGQTRATGALPTDRSIVVERFVDDLGDHRVCILTPFGARLHAPWATAVLDRLRGERPEGRIARITGVPRAAAPTGDVEAVWSDDGIAFRLPEAETAPPAEWFFPSPDEIEAAVTAALGHTSLFAAHFRECAARALLLPRKRPGQRTPLWAQRKRATDLLAIASLHPEFPMLLETFRECLRDVFDMPGLVSVLGEVQRREIQVTTVDTKVPSPFAASLLFSFVANFIYDGDAPLAERRAQALAIDQTQLAELLGEAELRSLLDPDATAELGRMLSRVAYPTKTADGVHDLLLAVGDLSGTELAARVDPPDRAASFAHELEGSRRIGRITMAEQPRWAAMEDMGRLERALGIEPPASTPAAFRDAAQAPEAALADLVARYARTHTPFLAASVAERFGLRGAGDEARLQAALAELVKRGKLATGQLLPRPSGDAKEYCDAEVLRTLRGKSLAKLRRAVEPVGDAAYGRLQVDWQLAPLRGPDAVRQAVAKLEGYALPASALESEILPARVPGYEPWHLDALCASGEIVWAGVEPIGPRDGRIMLFTTEHEPLLCPAPRLAEGPIAAKIRELLSGRGALFFAEIARLVGGFPADIIKAIWEMVWAGELTNDTLAPLRTLGTVARTQTAAARRPRDRVRERRMAAPRGEGRWSLRTSRWAGAGAGPTETERRAAQATVLLARYGVVTREAVQGEVMAGGFAAAYAVLKAMEESGRLRRGYFVAGRGATQFALPGADDRLRALRDPSDMPVTRVLAATDPANPYGAALPWPGGSGAEGEAEGVVETKASRPQRAAGARVILHDGALLGWVGRTSHTLLTFLPPAFLPPAVPPLGGGGGARAQALASLASALAELATGPDRVVLLSLIDGALSPAPDIAAALARAGFTLGPKGWMRRRPPKDAAKTAAADANLGPVRSPRRGAPGHA